MIVEISLQQKLKKLDVCRIYNSFKTYFFYLVYIDFYREKRLYQDEINLIVFVINRLKKSSV